MSLLRQLQTLIDNNGNIVLIKNKYIVFKYQDLFTIAKQKKSKIRIVYLIKSNESPEYILNNYILSVYKEEYVGDLLDKVA